MLLSRIALGKYMVILGPPGTGKSSTAWFWATTRAPVGTKILWLHLDAEEVMTRVCVIERSAEGSTKIKSLLLDEAVSSIPTESVSNFDGSVVVLDGVKDTDRYVALRGAARRFHAAQTSDNPRTLILVASAKFKVSTRIDEELPIREMVHQASWSLGDYVRALLNDTLRQQCRPAFEVSDLYSAPTLTRRDCLTRTVKVSRSPQTQLRMTKQQRDQVGKQQRQRRGGPSCWVRSKKPTLQKVKTQWTASPSSGKMRFNASSSLLEAARGGCWQLLRTMWIGRF
jgi:hypothetical protein